MGQVESWCQLDASEDASEEVTAKRQKVCEKEASKLNNKLKSALGNNRMTPVGGGDGTVPLDESGRAWLIWKDMVQASPCHTSLKEQLGTLLWEFHARRASPATRPWQWQQFIDLAYTTLRGVQNNSGPSACQLADLRELWGYCSYARYSFGADNYINPTLLITDPANNELEPYHNEYHYYCDERGTLRRQKKTDAAPLPRIPASGLADHFNLLYGTNDTNLRKALTTSAAAALKAHLATNDTLERLEDKLKVLLDFSLPITSDQPSIVPAIAVRGMFIWFLSALIAICKGIRERKGETLEMGLQLLRGEINTQELLRKRLANLALPKPQEEALRHIYIALGWSYNNTAETIHETKERLDDVWKSGLSWVSSVFGKPGKPI